MPDLLTPQVIAAETLLRHFLSPKGGARHSEARDDDLMYDEAFVLMKTFLEMSTKYPVAVLQRFGLVRTPAPPPVALYRLSVPQSTLSEAAGYLITAMGGPEMAYKIAGGTKWWQVRAGSGVEAEWIVMKKDWKDYQAQTHQHQHQHQHQYQYQDSRADSGTATPKRETSGRSKGSKNDSAPTASLDDDGEFTEEMNEMRCMLYIHGGAYYWGSINTHRYTIWRHARKMRGRCFAVNYRKAPQYPFPCAIQDCLAAYLYLVNPPPDAKHSPVDPKNIVLAGDSAGGGLVLALLQILRDTDGLSLPAGAVLISPLPQYPAEYRDVPPYSFIHKPSSLWPPPPPSLTNEIQGTLRHRISEAVHNFRHHGQASHDPVKADLRGTLTDTPPGAAGRTGPDGSEDTIGSNEQLPGPSLENTTDPTDDDDRVRTSAPDGVTNRSEDELRPTADSGKVDHHPGPHGETSHTPSRANPAVLFQRLQPRTQTQPQTQTQTEDQTQIRTQTQTQTQAQSGPSTTASTLAQCDTPMNLHDAQDRPISIDTQIQLYATNAQLNHPWVSPVLGYMGGLPPLFICAGDNEVLRDEIIYLAHKAANPDAYPIREDVRAQLPSLQGIEAIHGPTDVHLQVYDGTCHDLPLFSMTKPARGLFRAIATFARFCTPSAPGSNYVSRTPTASHRNSTVVTPLDSPGLAHTVLPPMSSLSAGDMSKRADGPGSAIHDSQSQTTPILGKPVAAEPKPISISRVPSLSAFVDLSLTPDATPARDLGSSSSIPDMALPEARPLMPTSRLSAATSPLMAELSPGSSEPADLTEAASSTTTTFTSSSPPTSTSAIPPAQPAPLKTSSTSASTQTPKSTRFDLSSSSTQDAEAVSFTHAGANSSERSSPIIVASPFASTSALSSGQNLTSAPLSASVTGLRSEAITPQRPSTPTPSGDDVGPRFGAGSGADTVDKERSRAGPGEAGWPGIYEGSRPFFNHMIRERISPDGHTRPLEPASELGALNMPADEIGMLKEGPATRYLNGQALYAKKYARAARQVEKRRLKNIRNAEEKDGRELRKMWGDRLKKDKGQEVEGRESGGKADMKDVPVAAGGSPGDERGMEKGKIEGKEKEKGKEKDLFDQSWSWTWALEGEAPPPSAIVSRRDFGEARKLALMADRMDDQTGPSFGGLSLWVALAGFFSNTSSASSTSGDIETSVSGLNKHHTSKRGDVRHGEASTQKEKKGKDIDNDNVQEQEKEKEKEKKKNQVMEALRQAKAEALVRDHSDSEAEGTDLDGDGDINGGGMTSGEGGVGANGSGDRRSHSSGGKKFSLKALFGSKHKGKT